ncbi:hypothetical protein RRG08_002054 [Elysia crispata]|uniref:Uncharacterized protein n=1 Tax=Elysia crispata TaxID=231223 RepID=A0AAE0ZKH5_9GAST|nr:hypothetical protein RRG08_002054 [Elysia crispata]
MICSILSQGVTRLVSIFSNDTLKSKVWTAEASAAIFAQFVRPLPLPFLVKKWVVRRFGNHSERRGAVAKSKNVLDLDLVPDRNTHASTSPRPIANRR